jgi:septal ring factor EnvC (AmiA/AmiB activator)
VYLFCFFLFGGAFKAKQEAEAQAKQEAEAKREAEERAKREAEERAKREAEEKAKREAEEKARLDAIAKRKAWGRANPAQAIRCHLSSPTFFPFSSKLRTALGIFLAAFGTASPNYRPRCNMAMADLFSAIS